MEDTLPLGGWLIVTAMSIAGAWMWLVLRPTNSWRRMVGILIPSAAGGMAMSLSLCTAYGWDNLHHKIVSSFFGGLLCMAVCTVVVKVVQSEAVGWVKQGVKRFFGLKDDTTDATIEPTPEEGDA